MRTITTAGGKTYEVDFCGADAGYLWITLSGYAVSLADAVTEFSDDAETAEITHDWDGNDHVTYRGYTKLVQVALVTEGTQIVLMKGE